LNRFKSSFNRAAWHCATRACMLVPHRDPTSLSLSLSHPDHCQPGPASPWSRLSVWLPPPRRPFLSFLLPPMCGAPVLTPVLLPSPRRSSLSLSLSRVKNVSRRPHSLSVHSTCATASHLPTQLVCTALRSPRRRDFELPPMSVSASSVSHLSVRRGSKLLCASPLLFLPSAVGPHCCHHQSPELPHCR
jgi:hypothetical protein